VIKFNYIQIFLVNHWTTQKRTTLFQNFHNSLFYKIYIWIKKSDRIRFMLNPKFCYNRSTFLSMLATSIFSYGPKNPIFIFKKIKKQGLSCNLWNTGTPKMVKYPYQVRTSTRTGYMYGTCWVLTNPNLVLFDWFRMRDTEKMCKW
jgi:hypothetical protein